MHDNDDDDAGGRTGFFAVDLMAFEQVCDIGSINAAVAYLVMARGTGGDNRTTSWSVNAIEQRTGISRPRAKAAVGALVGYELMTAGSGTRPRYKLLPPLDHYHEDYEPAWTWLPNALIDPGDGSGFGALSPIERLRKAQDLEAIRLLVALYNAQSLANDGGLDWREGGIFQAYERHQIGRSGAVNIWGFMEDRLQVYRNAPYARRFYSETTKSAPFYESLHVIQRAGLLEFVPHLMDGDGQEAEIIHPIAPTGIGEPWEQEVADCAEYAARAMLSEPYLAKLDALSPTVVAPVPITSPKVAVVGIGRLRYRARTRATSKWFADMMSRCEEAAARYRAYERGEQRAAAA